VEVHGDDGRDLKAGGMADERDYSVFFRQAWPALMRLAFARVGDAATAEDLVQDVLSDAHRQWANLADYDDPLAWARRAVLNRSISRWRRAGREQRALAVVGTADRNLAVPSDVVEADGELWAAVRSLPDRQRDVVLLLWFEDLPARTVASMLGCGEDTVRTHWRRARSRLAQVLDEREGESER
jgi:RNA polymerase sigma factor (sigma-70 family)